jgi:uncharacterized protein
MTISMYSASVPVFKQLLTSMNAILVKTDSVVNNEMNSETLLHARLFPDMLDFTRQVQIATDFAKGVTARLAGLDVPVYEDNETTFAELQTRVTKTLQFISSIPAEKIEGSEAREIITRPGTPKERRFNGQSYLLHYGLPQFFFHITTAYAILRSNGIELGKHDYMGTF